MVKRKTEPLALLVDRLQTPIGELLIIADRAGNLRTIDWTDHEARMRQLLDRYYGKDGYTLEPARDPGGLTRALRRLFQGRHRRHRQAAGRDSRHAFPEKRLEGAAQDRQRPHHQLRRAGAAHRQAQGSARGRPRQWPESDQHRRALPSRDRLQRHLDRLWRRTAAQEMAAGARRGVDTNVTLKSVPCEMCWPYLRSRTAGRPTGPKR